MPTIEVLLKDEGELTPYIHIYSDGFYNNELPGWRAEEPEEWPEPVLTLKVRGIDLRSLYYRVNKAVNDDGIPSFSGSCNSDSAEIDVSPEYAKGKKLETLKEFVRKQAEKYNKPAN